MSNIDDLVVNLKTHIEANSKKSISILPDIFEFVGYDNIYQAVLKNAANWIEIKKKEFLKNKDRILINYRKLYYVEENDIPFEALRLSSYELINRIDIYTELFVKNNIDDTTIMLFIKNIHLFLDITDEKEIKVILYDLLSLIEDNNNSKEVVERLKMKITKFNEIRENFDPETFVFNCFSKYVRDHPIDYNMMATMAVREHGRPFDKCVIN